MKNGILISFLTVGLAACGGESDSETPTINIEFTTGIKGVETQPTLSSAEISEGDIAILNTNYTGNVLEYSNVEFSFTPPEDQLIAIILSSALSDLDLLVSGNNQNLNSTFDDSNELIVIDAIAGENYRVEVESWGGSGEFELTLVEANRASIGLESHEYLVNLESIQVHDCIINGEQQEKSTDSDSSLGVISWTSGYIADPLANNRTSFNSVDGNTFTINTSYSESGGGSRFSGHAALTLTTDFATGAISGYGNASAEYVDVDEDEVGSCTYTSVETGQVIL